MDRGVQLTLVDPNTAQNIWDLIMLDPKFSDKTLSNTPWITNMVCSLNIQVNDFFAVNVGRSVRVLDANTGEILRVITAPGAYDKTMTMNAIDVKRYKLQPEVANMIVNVALTSR